MKLTAKTIKTLALPPGKTDKTFWDGGFGLRLRAGGATRWVVQYDLGGRTRRMTLGTANQLTLGAARAKAHDILAAVRLGKDPAAEKRQAHELAAETFGALLARYLPHKQAKAKAGSRSFDEVERHLVRYARPLHVRPITTIARREIATLVSAIAAKAGPTAANCMLGSLSGYFTWLIREGLLEANPAGHVNKAVTNGSRARVLSLGEFREIWHALGTSDYADIFRLLAWTAATKREVGGMRFDELDLDSAEFNVPAARARNGKPRTIPLTPSALALLEARPRNGRELVFGHGRDGFTGWARAKAALDQRIAAARQAAGITAPMEPWVVHDLRRFFATQASEILGVAPHVVEAALGHIAVFKSGVAGVYNRSSYGVEHRRALERWAQLLDEVVSGKRPAATIVRFGKRR